MALDTLKGVKQFGNEPIVVMDELREQYPERFTETGAMDHKWFEETIRPKNFVYVRHDKNSLSFTLQNGLVSENGVNGCQVDTLIYAAKVILEGLNEKMRSRYTQGAINHLESAIDALENRTKRRKLLGIESTMVAGE